jgi:hypothetical protein
MPALLCGKDAPWNRLGIHCEGFSLYKLAELCEAPGAMVKKFLPLLTLPLLLAGCSTTFTNLTPRQQERNAENAYPVEVALSTRQQTLRWETIKAQIVTGNNSYPMRPVPLMTNRWEGLLPVPPEQKVVHYHYRFDFSYLRMGMAGSDNAISPDYTLRIVDPKP